MNSKSQNTTREYWNKENLPTDALVLFRNLVGGMPINIKLLYDDRIKQKDDEILAKKQEKKEKYRNKDKEKTKKSKNEIKSKKERIIEKNIIDKQARNLKEDRIRIKSFSDGNTTDFERWLSYLSTDLGRMELKLVALRKAVLTKNKIMLLELALQIDESLLEIKDDKHFFQKIKKQIDGLATKELQLELLGNRFPPLDLYNNISFRLDDWQLEVLKLIVADTSVLVTAPTSSGKTILSTYFATIGNTVLYVVPSKPLAFQIASIFHSIAGEGVALFVDDFSYYPSTDIRVVIGTPYELENKFPTLPDLDIAVFDEIHNINSECGACYERLIKWHKGNFLALSATIKNEEEVLGWLKSLNTDRDVKLVSYKKRFINIQRHLWDNSSKKLDKLHPLSCLTIDDFSNGNIPQLPFTPWDCISIWKSLNNILPNEQLANKLETSLNPEIYFQATNRISLDDSKTYELSLKEYLSHHLDKSLLTNLLKSHHKEDLTPGKNFEILDLLLNLKNQDMFPCIAFNINTVVVQELFTKIVNGLEERERITYPYHYENLEHRYKLYQDYVNKREKLISETKEAEKEAKTMRFDKAELSQYQQLITERYQRNLKTLENIKDRDPSLLKLQLQTLKAEYNSILETDEIQDTDLFEKCPDFCFTHDPMKSNRIRELKRIIQKKMKMKMDYTNVMLQGLKRGIGIYTKDLPDVYLRIVQELAQNKEISVVISDESLALGINMPFRTSIMCGWANDNNIPSLLFQQMSGRAGRRGMDSEGHVIFANVYWKNIMKGEMEKMVGLAKIPTSYNILSHLNPNLKESIIRINSNYLSCYVSKNTSKTSNKSITLKTFNESDLDLTEISKKVIWKLRKYNEGSIRMGSCLEDLELWLKKETVTKVDVIRLLKYIIISIFANNHNTHYHINEIESYDKTSLISKELNELLVILERNRLDDYISDTQKHVYINLLVEIANITKILHNIIADLPYFQATQRLLNMSFYHCKQIIYNYHKLK